MKYPTPELFEEKANSLLDYAERTEGVTPTVLWLEVKMDIQFYDYEQRKDFSDSVKRVRKRAFAIYEQKASCGQVVQKVAGMYLVNNLGYVPETQKMEVKADTTVNLKGMRDLMDDAMNLKGEARERYMEKLREIAES